MYGDQADFIDDIPENLKTPRMHVTVYDSKGAVICQYVAHRGLRLQDYARGPETFVNMEATTEYCMVKVFSEKTKKLIQIHQGVYDVD